jgi:histidinol-phosphate aminotransferase
MIKFDQLIPERFKALGGYAPGKPIKQAEAESGVRMIKMASNENPFGPSPLAMEAMKRAAGEVNLYPDNEYPELRQRIAAEFGMKPDQVVLGAGSTNLLDLTCRLLLGPGLNAVSSERSFIVYPIVVRSTGAEYRTVPMKDDTFDLDAIANAIDSNTRIVFLTNPNNPTGTMVTAHAVDNFLARVPDHVTVILDEAYYDFASYFAQQRGIDYSHSLDYVRQGKNVLVLRTFSKAYGLAAIRVGYGFAPTELAYYLTRVRTVFTISSIAEAGAIAALDDQAHFQKTIENNAAGVPWLMEHFQKLGYKPVQTWANFIYCEMGEDAAALVKRLQAEGVIVRPLTGPWGARTAIRVTVGTPEQNQKFITALKKVTAGAAVNS